MSSMASPGSSSVRFTIDTIIIQHDAKYFADLGQLLSSPTPKDLKIFGKDGSITIHKKAIQLNSSIARETLEISDAIEFAEFTMAELVKVCNYAYFGHLELPEADIQRFVIVAKAFGFDGLHQLLIRALNPEHETAETQEKETQTPDPLLETENESGNADSLLTANLMEPVIKLTRLSHSEIMKYSLKGSPLLTVKRTKIHWSTPKMTKQMLEWWIEEIDKGTKYFPSSLLAQKFAAEDYNILSVTLWEKKESLVKLYQEYVKGNNVPHIEPFLPYLKQIEAKTNFVKRPHLKWASTHVKQFLRLWLDAKDMKRFPKKFIAAKLAKLGIQVSPHAVHMKKERLSMKYLNHKRGKEEPEIQPFISLLRQIHSD